MYAPFEEVVESSLETRPAVYIVGSGRLKAKLLGMLTLSHFGTLDPRL